MIIVKIHNSFDTILIRCFVLSWTDECSACQCWGWSTKWATDEPATIRTVSCVIKTNPFTRERILFSSIFLYQSLAYIVVIWIIKFSNRKWCNLIKFFGKNRSWDVWMARQTVGERSLHSDKELTVCAG